MGNAVVEPQIWTLPRKFPMSQFCTLKNRVYLLSDKGMGGRASGGVHLPLLGALSCNLPCIFHKA
jgi:hypothetical protein